MMMTELEWLSESFQFCILYHVFNVKYYGQYKVQCVASGNRVQVDNLIDISTTTMQNSTVRLMLVASAHQRNSFIIVDIENTYLIAETVEKVWTRLEKGFSPLSGKMV